MSVKLSTRRVFLTMALLASSFPERLISQTGQESRPIEIPNDPCLPCRVNVRAVVRIGPTEGPGSLSGIPFDVVIDRRNRYWVSAVGPPALYDSTGKFLQMVGRTGDGPNEYRGPTVIRPTTGDSMLVLDLRRGRGFMLNAQQQQARTFTLAWPGLPMSYLLFGNILVASGQMPTPATTGLPLHFFTTDAPVSELTKSFGIRNEKITGRQRTYEWRIASGQNNTFWSAEMNRYRLAQWSSSGVLLRRFIRKPAWFADTSRIGPVSGTVAPDPWMTALAQDAEGLLWVAVLTAAPNWKDGWFGGRNTGGRGELDAPSVRPFDHFILYQTTIEVIDPSTTSLITSFSLKQHVVSMLPGRRAAVYSEDANGLPVLEILEFTLSGRR